MSEMKSYKTVNEYIEKSGDNVRDILKKFRKIVKEIVPEADEAISYGVPAFKLKGKSFIYFAGYKKHVSFYTIPPGTESFNKSIAPYIAGKGTLKFMLNKPIRFDLVRQIVNFVKKRLEEKML